MIAAKPVLKSHATTTRLIDWTRVDEFEWRCGNVRLIACEGEKGWLSWYVKIKVKGRWRWAYCKSRPHGYGSAGQAKRGVSKWAKAYLY